MNETNKEVKENIEFTLSFLASRERENYSKQRIDNSIEDLENTMKGRGVKILDTIGSDFFT